MDVSVTSLFTCLASSQEPLRWRNTELSLSKFVDGYSLRRSDSCCVVSLSNREFTWLASHGLQPHDQECSREKVAQVGFLLQTGFLWFNVAEMTLSAARKSQPYNGANLVFGAPFEDVLKQEFSNITKQLKKIMEPYELADWVIPHHPDGLHATVTILWENEPVEINEAALSAWSESQPEITLRIVSNQVTRTPFVISSSGLILLLAQGIGDQVKSIREQVGAACNVADRNLTKSTCHIVLGYLQPNEDWNNQAVVDEIVAFVQEVNARIDFECQMKEVKLVTYNKQTLEPSAITSAKRFPLI